MAHTSAEPADIDASHVRAPVLSDAPSSQGCARVPSRRVAELPQAGRADWARRITFALRTPRRSR